MITKECHILPNGQEVEYIDETHQYFVNGEEVPSITQLIALKLGDLYSQVRPEILKAASDYGTKVHSDLSKWIELRQKDPNVVIEPETQEVYNYFDHIEPIYKVIPLLTERVVALYGLDGKVAACGRFDLLCKIGDDFTLADFKTTSTINRQYVTNQLNLYLTAAYQSGYIQDTNMKLAVIHLSGEKAKVVPITKLADDYYLQFTI